MFHLIRSVLVCSSAWVPVLRRMLSASGLSDHNQQRVMECRNGEKVGNNYHQP